MRRGIGVLIILLWATPSLAQSLPDKVAPVTDHPRAWAILAALDTSVAVYDAQVTSQCLAANTCHEVDPLAKPFTSTLPHGLLPTFATSEAATVALLGDRMQNSNHAWARRLWWMPQVIDIAAHTAAVTYTQENVNGGTGTDPVGPRIGLPRVVGNGRGMFVVAIGGTGNFGHWRRR